MLRLVWKDAIVAGWFLLLGLPLYAMQAFGMASAAPALLAVTVLFTGGLAFGSIGIEEIQGTEALWCSLPVSRRDIVFARYATTAAGTVLGLGLSWAVGRIAAATVFGGRDLPAHHLGLGAYSTLFAALMLCASLYLPCHYRLGAGRGLAAFSVILLGVLVLLSVLSSIVIHLAGGAEALHALREQDPARLEAAREWLDRWGWLVSSGLAATALALFAASAGLSAYFYSKRDC